MVGGSRVDKQKNWQDLLSHASTSLVLVLDISNDNTKCILCWYPSSRILFNLYPCRWPWAISMRTGGMRFRINRIHASWCKNYREQQCLVTSEVIPPMMQSVTKNNFDGTPSITYSLNMLLYLLHTVQSQGHTNITHFAAFAKNDLFDDAILWLGVNLRHWYCNSTLVNCPCTRK